MDAATIRSFDERAPPPDETETATFALGCFWGPDAVFGAVDGVVRTRVGYAGGTTPNPSYQDLGDHSEAVQVDYDPAAVSFGDLVDVAIARHSTRHQPRKRQYQHVLFYETENDRATIDAALDALAVPDVQTRVEPLDSFTVGEPYHQKYTLGSEPATLRAFEDAGYDDDAVRESPAAATLNGRAAGHDVPDLETVQ